MNDLYEVRPNLGTLTPEVKALWLEALRSGEYRQGRNWLHTESDTLDGGSYCCLGVLALIMRISRGDLCAGINLDQVGLQPLLGTWSLSDSDVKFVAEDPGTHSTVQRKLAAMNDTGLTFAAIADWIETNL